MKLCANFCCNYLTSKSLVNISGKCLGLLLPFDSQACKDSHRSSIWTSDKCTGNSSSNAPFCHWQW